MQDVRQLLTVDEVCQKLKVSSATLYRWAAARRIPSVRLMGVLRFDPEEVDNWIGEQAAQPSALRRGL